LGSTPDPAGGAYSAPPDLLAGFKGPTSKGRGWRGEEGEKREVEGSGKEGRGGKGKRTPQAFHQLQICHYTTAA